MVNGDSRKTRNANYRTFVEIQEVIRRWQAGGSQRQIAEETAWRPHGSDGRYRARRGGGGGLRPVGDDHRSSHGQAQGGLGADHRRTRGFQEYSQHRGFVTDPARVRHPKDKPKVERSVSYVQERLCKAPRAGSPWWSSRMKSAMPCCPGTGRRPTRSPHSAYRRGPSRPSLGLHALYSVPSSSCPPGQRVEVKLDSKLERILVQALEQEAMPQLPLPIPAGRFARPVFRLRLAAGDRS